MKTFTVWFKVGMDFKENFEAEDARDAERKWEDKMAASSCAYVKALTDNPEIVIYDIAEVPDENS